MQSAELFGIDEEQLGGFLEAIPRLFNESGRFWIVSMECTESNFVDCDRILSSTHIYTASTGFCVILTEYLKSVGAATFKIHAYVPWLSGFRIDVKWENCLKTMIMEYSEKDMSQFRDIALSRYFICPNCRAQYSFHVLKKREDGYFQCQNCGKFVFIRKNGLETENKSDSTEHH